MSQHLEHILSEIKRISLVQDQILTKLLALQPPKPEPAVVVKSLVTDEHRERAKLLSCPKCEGSMSVRSRKSDGEPFFGCTNFPTCNGILPGGAQPTAKALATVSRLKEPIRRPIFSGSNFTENDTVNQSTDDDSVPF